MSTTLVAQLSDLHIREGGAEAYGVVDTRAALAAAVDHVNALKQRPAGVVVSGDLGDLGTAAEYAIVRGELDRLAMPYHPIPGNHDGDAFWDVFADRMEAPVRDVGHVARIGGVRAILLDTRVPDALHGRLDARRAAWLAERLAESEAESETPTLLVLHHPPIDTGIGHMDAIGLEGRERLAPILRRGRAPLAILCGHIHRTIVSSLAGVPVLVAPSCAHAVALDLAPDAPSRFRLEPPGVLVHAVAGETVTSHVSPIGDYPGPFPFFAEDGRLVGT